MGRSPCCEKEGLKKGPWTPEEDKKLLAYIDEHGHGSWRALPIKAGLQRCGKSCRLRWTNYLRPDIKRGKFSQQEEQTIIQLHALLGNRWSAIATHLPKRTDNEIKNYWNTHVKKRLAKMGIDPVSHKPKNDTLLSADSQSKTTANLNHMAQWKSARLEAEARLVKQSKLRSTKLVPPPVVPPQPVVAAEQEPLSSTLSTTEIGDSSCNFIEFVGDSFVLCEEGEEVCKSFQSTTSLPAMENVWTAESIASKNSNETVPSGTLLKSFTGLLLNNNSNDNCIDDDRTGRIAEGGGDSGLIGSGCGGPNYDENYKNYWNNILNLVNSPWSDYPDIL